MSQIFAKTKNIPVGKNVIVGVVKGLMLAVIISVAALFITAFILMSADFPENNIKLAVLIVTYIGTFFSGLISASGIKQKGWLVGGIVGIVYMLLLFLAGSFITGSLQFTLNTLFNILIAMLVGALGGIFGVNFSLREKNKKYKF